MLSPGSCLSTLAGVVIILAGHAHADWLVFRGNACQTGVAHGPLPHTLAVKFVDESGDVIATDARPLLGVKELQTVVVRGRVQRTNDGRIALLANGLYVKQ